MTENQGVKLITPLLAPVLSVAELPSHFSPPEVDMDVARCLKFLGDVLGDRNDFPVVWVSSSGNILTGSTELAMVMTAIEHGAINQFPIKEIIRGRFRELDGGDLAVNSFLHYHYRLLHWPRILVVEVREESGLARQRISQYALRYKSHD